MAFWVKKNVVDENETTGNDDHDNVHRAKEVVDVALALYKMGIESSEEVFEHIQVRYDMYNRLVYFYFLTDEIKEKFIEVREYKMNDEPIEVNDYYKCSHLIGLLKRCIRIEKDKVIR